MELIGGLTALLIWILLIALFICFIRIPIIIAKKRGVSGNELSVITALSWLGIILFFLWIIALVLSLVYQPKKWIEKEEPKSFDVDKLDKLHTLYKNKVITKEEYETQKKKVLG